MRSSSTSADRGGRWVVAQFVLMAVILGLSVLPPDWPGWIRLAGVPIALAGLVGIVWSGRTLGRSLTPYPRPLDDAVLVERGPYSLVRHPIYGAGTLLFVGGALVASVPATIAALGLPLLWYFKAGVEERHLSERFPAYAEYRRRVRRRLIPYVL